jgi:hypothetical protein
MLDKIQNINPQDKYKSGLKVPVTNLYIIHANDYNQNKRKDSALFSPLAKLLSKINWHILKIEYPSEDEVFFNFAVDDLEFITLINFNELYSEYYQEVSIYKSRIKNYKKYEYEIKLNVEKDDISILDASEPIKIEAIERMFKRVSDQESIYWIQSNYKDEIVFGLEDELKNELNYILKVVYTFLSTKFANKIKTNFILKTQSNYPIIIQKIALTNTD